MNFIKPLLLLSNNIFLILLGLFGIGLIIGFHELGHFLFGKLFKIKTPAFAVGFGPKLYQRKIGETNFSIGAIPLGGYVESDKESFESKPYWQKMIVLAGGISFNLLFAYFAFCILFMLGLPKTEFLYPINTVPIIQKVAQDPVITQLGIQAGDKIIAINNESIENKPLLFLKKLKDTKEKLEKEKTVKTAKITLDIERDGKTTKIEPPFEALLNAFNKKQIEFKFAEPQRRPFFESIKKGIRLTNVYIINTLLIFKYMFVKRDTSALGGPILIISKTAEGASKGIKIFLLLLAIISVSLAVINLIPLPILDGGQALLYTIEAIIRRKLPEKTKEVIMIASWIFMLILFVLISTRDVWRVAKQHFGNSSSEKQTTTKK